MPQFLSTQRIAELIGRPVWQVRIVVDSLPIPVQRIGRHRAIPEDRIGEIAKAVEDRYGKAKVGALAHA